MKRALQYLITAYQGLADSRIGIYLPSVPMTAFKILLLPNISIKVAKKKWGFILAVLYASDKLPSIFRTFSSRNPMISSANYQQGIAIHATSLQQTHNPHRQTPTTRPHSWKHTALKASGLEPGKSGTSTLLLW